ncbi:putative Peptidase S8 and S53 [Nostocoides japonicum T1-X7]|uniref:Putative Peptidase S8 and S53 n=1 Tax=Nostocoides japonicum T1-X7 TaxID=1194083 RepID=A0A077LVG4_9MICO|nr:S53 family peptidase [Tetrasphaera japonica]CCH77666.1 putative Peptidase S8 and S53 [Tetrasphaera japonica T1-X7]
MARARRGIPIAGAAAALATAVVVAAPTATTVISATTTGTASRAVHALVATSGAAQPAIGTNPPRVKAGVVAKGFKAASPDAVVFSCQSASAPTRCFGPQQMRKAYGTDKLIKAGNTGKGQTIVILDAFQSPTVQQDLDTFDAVWGLPNTKVKVVAPQGLTPWDPNDANQVSWAGEISLDVQWAHAIAPRAKIVLALAKTNNDNDLQAALAYVVNHRLGDVLSQSFGEAEVCYGVNPDGTRQPGTTLAAQHRIYQKAQGKRMTLLASAGDSGSTQPTCDGASNIIAASTPASDPLVTGVGGTQLFANMRTGAYQREVVWNEEARFGYRSSGGGGFSSVYAVPSFQKGLGSLPSRGVPDVSYNAAIDGGVLVAFSAGVYPSGTFFIFGGTSAGSPQWAGLLADINQLNHGPVGGINPTLYQIAAKAPSAYHDITVGQNGDFGLGGFTAGTGWDAASGLGTPVAPVLARQLVARR